MDAPRSLRALLLLGAFGSLGFSGCASAPPTAVARSAPEEASPPAAAPPAEPPAAPPAQDAKSPSPPDPQEIKVDDRVVVVEPGGDDGSVSLVEAARAERERKAHARRPVAVITNKTLSKYATGQVTVAAPKPPKEGAADKAAATMLEGEQYWRDRGLEIRTRWHQASEEVKDLEQRAADWRRRFYAEDDPYFRDGQIKPEWDRVLDRLQQKRAEADGAKQDLARFLEDGRRAGALPGWLREGTELEPEEAKKEPPAPEPVEPPVLNEDGV